MESSIHYRWGSSVWTQQTVSESDVLRPRKSDPTLNNVNHQLLDLCFRRIPFRDHGHVLWLPANPQAHFYRSSEIGKTLHSGCEE